MREKLQTLPLTQLREMAKEQGIKGVTTLKKADLIDKLCAIADTADGSGKVSASVESEKEEEKKTYQMREHQGKENQQREYLGRESQFRDSQNRENQQRDNSGREYPLRDNLQRGYQSRSYQQRSEAQRGYPLRDNSSRTYQQRGDLPNNYQVRENQRSYQQRNENQNGAAAGGVQTSSEGRDIQTMSHTEASLASFADQRTEQQRAELINDFQELDSGIEANGILEVMPDGFGFIRCENFLPGEHDVYVAPSQIRRFNLKTGDIVKGSRRVKSPTEKFAALLYINTVNGYSASIVERRPNFENLTPIFPDKRLHLEVAGVKNSTAMRVMDLVSPIGKGQRGMIVSPPKAGKTTLLKQVAKAVTTNHPDMHLIILLIDERPEEVTDIKEAIQSTNVEVIYSTFDELPERHKRVSEMVIERAKRLVEHGRDVMILLDSITRLARAYNLVVPPSGRTLSGGLDPAALHMPKRFFGAARNIREGGSLTILATALIDTGSRMDDVIYEEFKGTGNMELVLDRKLSERRIFPALDILRSGTRRDDLLLTMEESEALDIIHKATNSQKPEESVERILDLFSKTRNNTEFVEITRKRRFF